MRRARRCFLPITLILLTSPVLAQNRRGALFRFSKGRVRAQSITRDRRLAKPGPAIGMLARTLIKPGSELEAFPLDGRRALLIWKGMERDAPRFYALVENRGGRLLERAIGAWPKGWRPVGIGDFTGDGRGDLLLIRRITGRRTYTSKHPYTRFECLIVPQGKSGFLLPKKPEAPGRLLLIERAYDAHFAVADDDRDGIADLILHVVSERYARETRVFALRGDGRGGFAGASDVLADIPASCGNLAVAELSEQGGPAVLLAPGRYARNYGQSWLLHRSGILEADHLPARGLDLAPEKSGCRPEDSDFSVRFVELDGDGKPDLITTRGTPWSLDYAVQVRWGLGGGRFAPRDILTLRRSSAPIPPILALCLADSGPEPAGDVLKPPEAERLGLDLMSEEPAASGAAMAALRWRGRAALPLLRSFFPRETASKAEIEDWIAELGQAERGLRDRAARELLAQGPACAAALRASLEHELNPEARWRAVQILAAFDRQGQDITSAPGRRRYRALALAESIGGAEARALLRGVAEAFGPGTRLGAEARMALTSLR